MTIPLTITFHGLEGSDAIDRYIQLRAVRLNPFARYLLACRVAVEAPHRHKRHGRHYRVRLDLTTRGAELVVDRCPDAGKECEDLYAAIDQAFDHACRRLRDSATRKRHPNPRDRVSGPRVRPA